MYTVFSEILRSVMMSTSLVLKKMASGGFEYKTVYFDHNENKLLVKYLHNNKSGKEGIKDFIQSCYFNMLSPKEAQKFLYDVIRYEKKKKSYEIVQDTLVPELFNVKNKATERSEDVLLKDLVNDDVVLENLSAPYIRMLIRSYAVLQKEDEIFELDIDKEDEKIIKLYKKN